MTHRALGAFAIFIIAPFLVTATPVAAWAQIDVSRREIATPGLVLETGTRTAACDVLTFTNAGQFLLATGDDKVVRTWKFTGTGLEPIHDPAPADVPQAVLRWTSHRERRGNIYAAAVSPDSQGRYIAVGGAGVRNSQIAVLDRFTGAIKNALPYLSADKRLEGASIWSIVFSPSGNQVSCGTGSGAVWTWNWQTDAQAKLVGQHPLPDGLNYNYVRFLAYHDGQLVSADEHGGVYRWHLSQPDPTAQARVFAFSNAAKPGTVIRAFALSKDGWLAAALETNAVELRHLADGRARTIALDSGNYPSALAFDPAGQKLAISLRLPDQTAAFYKETKHRIAIYDVRTASPTLEKQLSPSYRIEALAFHPDGKHLAAAGGLNHDVSVYALTGAGQRLGRPMAGPGECLWGVSLSKDGRYLGFDTTRNADPPHPNDQGAGPRKVFDLERRLFVPGVKPSWTPLPRSADGWSVQFTKRADQWNVIPPLTKGGNNPAPPLAKGGPGGGIPLPWETKKEEFPRCYGFLAKDATHPTRLIVGHLYGASVFELTDVGIWRTRLLVGHDSEVTGLALSADGKRLVTCSRDQTIAGWSLEDWPSHPQLGANWFVKGNRLWVGSVDQGSPCWEAGLSEGDEVVFLAIARKPVYNRGVKKYGKDGGLANEVLKLLHKPKAGDELYLAWKRPGEDVVREQSTTLPDRPIWRFFPQKDGEWVLWRYQDYLYDTSTRGDSVIGWQVNSLDDKGEFDVKGTPRFFRAEQFRNAYHRPKEVSGTLTSWGRTEQGRSTFVAITPPVIALSVPGAQAKDTRDKDGKIARLDVKDKGFKLDIAIAPNSERQNQELGRVILWINDYQFRRWEGADLAKHIVKRKVGVLERGDFELKGVDVPLGKLRSGANIVFVQCYNKADVRGESQRLQVANGQPRPQANMHGLFVGVGNYAKSTPRQANLGAPQDAEVLAETWEKNRGPLYARFSQRVLKDKQATPANVLKEFDALAKQVQPDDLLVFHLGGHGVARRKLLAEVAAAKLPRDVMAKFQQQVPGLGEFFFLCGDFDFQRIRDTTIALEDLYEKLVKLPCHKVITLDACNSAAVDPSKRKETDIIRLLTKDGVGPIIFVACKAEESAIEFPGFIVEPAAGLFAQAIVKTIQDDFPKSKNQSLTPAALQKSLETNVARWVGELHELDAKNKGLEQTPRIFLPDLAKNFAILSSQDRRP